MAVSIVSNKVLIIMSYHWLFVKQKWPTENTLFYIGGGKINSLLDEALRLLAF